MDLRLLRNNVLVKLMPMNNRVYKNIIYKPDTCRNDELHYVGLVESFGGGIKSKKGASRPLDLTLGDLVLFARHTGVRVMVDSIEYRLIKFSEILAILEE